MFARHSELKSILMAGIHIDGKPYSGATTAVQITPNCLQVVEYSVVETARLTIFESNATIRTKDKLLLVVPNDALYMHGEVLGFKSVIAPGSDDARIVIAVKPNDKESREALKMIKGPLASLYVESKT